MRQSTIRFLGFICLGVITSLAQAVAEPFQALEYQAALAQARNEKKSCPDRFLHHLVPAVQNAR